MISKILTAAAAMIIVISANSSMDFDTGETTMTTEPRTFEIYPDNETIKADLIGHFMYVTTGAPGFWKFSSPSSIQLGNIGSTRRKGDLFEFSVTMFLVDYKTTEQNRYRVDTVITYKMVSGSWQLLTVQGSTIKNMGTVGMMMPDYLQDGC